MCNDNNLIISNRTNNEVFKINRNSGEIIWTMGGPLNEFIFIDDPKGGFNKQHDVRRIENVNFEIEFFPKIEIAKSGNLEEDILNFTNKINKFLEEKIIEKPEEWFWLHNRWDKRFN